MPLTMANLTINFPWQLAKTNAGTGSTKQGPASKSFNLQGLDLDNFDQIYVADVTIGASTFSDITLTSLTNLVGETFSFAHTLAILVKPSGANIALTAQSANPIGWFFGSASDTIPIKNGGVFAYSDSVGGPGYVIDGTHRTFRIRNTGAGACTTTLVVLGSDTV